MSLRFHSTRGLAPTVDLRQAALSGLAPDGGLYLPTAWPHFSSADIAAMRGQSYAEIAFRVLRPFMHGVVPDDILRDIIAKAYAGFDVADTVALRPLKNGTHILELFHGPTLAFKDVALQFLGHLFEHFLGESGQRMTVIGATSGDTGSAAMAALAGRRNIDLFIMYPDKGPSEIQRRQMTCVEAANVHALAVKGSFDDCQAIVKEMFADESLRAELNLSTVNSINLVRILAQIVYYFYAASRLDGAPTFVVPTGNFGDIYAGYAAAKCGLPVAKLVVASNSNDILTRFFATGRMSPQAVRATLSPSMDIQISSNFERLLFDLCNGDAAMLRTKMADLKKGGFDVPPQALAAIKNAFAAGSATDAETLSTIEKIYNYEGYILDPHTAVAVNVAERLGDLITKPVVCLATANPSKFPDTVARAIAIKPQVPPRTAALISKPERTTLWVADTGQIVKFIKDTKAL